MRALAPRARGAGGVSRAGCCRGVACRAGNRASAGRRRQSCIKPCGFTTKQRPDFRHLDCYVRRRAAGGRLILPPRPPARSHSFKVSARRPGLCFFVLSHVRRRRRIGPAASPGGTRRRFVVNLCRCVGHIEPALDFANRDGALRPAGSAPLAGHSYPANVLPMRRPASRRTLFERIDPRADPQGDGVAYEGL